MIKVFTMSQEGHHPKHPLTSISASEPLTISRRIEFLIYHWNLRPAHLWGLHPRNESRVGLHYKGKVVGMIQPPKQPVT